MSLAGASAAARAAARSATGCGECGGGGGVGERSACGVRCGALPALPADALVASLACAKNTHASCYCSHTHAPGGGADGGLPVCRAARFPGGTSERGARQHHWSHERCARGLGCTGLRSCARVCMCAWPHAAPHSHAHTLHRAPASPLAVGVITPYREQRALLRQTFEEVCGKGPASEVRGWAGGGAEMGQGGDGARAVAVGRWRTHAWRAWPAAAASARPNPNCCPQPTPRCSSRPWTPSRASSWMSSSCPACAPAPAEAWVSAGLE